jgi:hypothetical protein
MFTAALMVGKSWEIISPDLSRHDPKTVRAEWAGPITKDNTGAEYTPIFSHSRKATSSKGLLGRKLTTD